jgi:hypothetical protein
MRRMLGFALLALLLVPSLAGARVRVRATASGVSISNGVVMRSWSRNPFRTTLLRDLRGDGRTWSHGHRDFALGPIGSDALRVDKVAVAQLPGGGKRLTLTLGGVPGLKVTRTAELLPGVAGMKMQTIVTPAAGLALDSVALEELAPGTARPTLQAFRAGADWRDPTWTGPPAQIGDPHGGTWRAQQTAARGAALAGPGEWLSLAAGDRSLFMVALANDFPSQRARYDGASASMRAEYGRDVISLGPFEEQAHVENALGTGRARTVLPGQTLALDPVFVGMGDHDGDEAWQFHRSLPPAQQAVVVNTDKLDANRISTGAKDDADFAMVKQVAPIARRLGADTFVLDDGWPAIDGDWYPDSPQHREPRGYPARFPDDTFAAVRTAIAPMRLGLWMTPGEFNPASATFAQHPAWMCQPVGSALYAYNKAQPDDGSNEAGIVPWGPDAFGHIEARIRDAIERYGARYFKFDFLMWLDCAGQGDLYHYRDAFVAMLDRLRARHPEVTFTIDETNDYRLFPFASTSRGPTWFQNGAPEPDQLLHNLWNLSPFVPAYDIGQHVLGGRAWERHPVSTLMAAALPSQITFYTDIREIPDAVVAEARTWIDFYDAHREAFAGVTYPLLADPLRKDWTALQTWDPDAGSGALLAFRQQGAGDEREIALRNVPAGSYRLTLAPTGESLGTVSGERLRSGLPVTIARPDGAAVILIERLSP